MCRRFKSAPDHSAHFSTGRTGTCGTRPTEPQRSRCGPTHPKRPSRCRPPHESRRTSNSLSPQSSVLSPQSSVLSPHTGTGHLPTTQNGNLGAASAEQGVGLDSQSNSADRSSSGCVAAATLRGGPWRLRTGWTGRLGPDEQIRDSHLFSII